MKIHLNPTVCYLQNCDREINKITGFPIFLEFPLYVTPPWLPMMDGIGTYSYLLSVPKEVSCKASARLALCEHVLGSYK